LTIGVVFCGERLSVSFAAPPAKAGAAHARPPSIRRFSQWPAQ